MFRLPERVAATAWGTVMLTAPPVTPNDPV